MDVSRLYHLIAETSEMRRKGAEVVQENIGPVSMTLVEFMPPVDATPPGFEDVDLCLVVIRVNVEAAKTRAAELRGIMETYPQPARLAAGPSYIEVGAEVGDQGAALQLFAVGKVAGLWDVVTPAFMGIHGEQAKAMAGQGFVMITGLRPAEAAPAVPAVPAEGGQ